MKNSILLLVFNYSDCLNNKQKICDLYKDHFKKIIVYSDIPKNTNEQLHEDVNYVDICKGFFVHRIFNHFYDNYKNDINKCDGIFYTMDDMIINTNILHLYDTKKIIYFYQKIEKINEHKPDWGGWSLKRTSYKNKVEKLPLEKHGIAGVASKPSDLNIDDSIINGGGWADFFYLPKKILTKKLFDLFRLFSDVFLEISIPTIIANIEKNKDHYSDFDFLFLGGEDRKKFENGIFVKKVLKNNALLVHAIKFGQNPKSFDFLNDIFRKKKCVIITTINEPTETIHKHINNTEYDVIIVGDLKTPNTYKNIDCIFLDTKNQKKIVSRSL